MIQTFIYTAFYKAITDRTNMFFGSVGELFLLITAEYDLMAIGGVIMLILGAIKHLMDIYHRWIKIQVELKENKQKLEEQKIESDENSEKTSSDSEQ